MTISASVVNQQITASVGETAIDVSVGGSSPIDATVSGGFGPSGETGPPGTTSWTGIVDRPTQFSPELHASSHAIGGVDFVAPAAIGASTIAVATSLQLQVDGKAANNHTHAASAITSGTIASARLPNATASSSGAIIVGTGLSASSGVLSVAYGDNSTSACRGDDSRLSNSREWSASTVSQADAESGISGSRFAFTPQRVFQAIAAWWNGSAAKTKLDGIADGATANATDAQLRDRATHTGTQVASTISDFVAAVVAAAPPTTDASLLTSGTLPDARLSSNIARAADVSSAVAALVNSAPATLDTLAELASALGSDANFSTTVTNSLASKAPSSHNHDASAINAGTLSADRLPLASANTRGAVRIGTGVAIDGNGVISVSIPSLDWASITNKPTTFAPDAHAASHLPGGSDELFDQSLNIGDTPYFSEVRLTGGSIYYIRPQESGPVEYIGFGIEIPGQPSVEFLRIGLDGRIRWPDGSVQTAPWTGTVAAANVTGLATVATSGNYENLVNLPTLFDGKYASLSGLPTLFDGKYASLSDLPTLFDGEYSSLNNRPTLFDGEYSSLNNRPTLFDGDYLSLSNRPALFDGKYSSLTGTPSTFAPSSHSHAASDITSGTLSETLLPTSGVATGTYTSVTVDTYGRVTAGSSPAIAYSSLTGLPTLGTAAAQDSTAFAAASHSHAASDLTSGTLDAARLPLATTTTAGAVIVGTGLGVTSGTISVTQFTVRSDVVSSTAYTGRAVAGSATSASVWTIRRSVYTSAGTVSSTATATNVKWDDRLTASYS